MITNLYAKIENNKVTALLMPDQHGTMRTHEPVGPTWYGIQWPINPHFTGATGIIEQIESKFPNREAINAS